MPSERIVAKVEELARALCSRLERESALAIAARGRFSIAVPGGSVAVKLLPRLATSSIDWSRTDVFQADERAVPPDDPDSNYAALMSAGIRGRIHRMRGENPDLEAAARDYAEDLARTLGDPPRLDVAILGVGPDGHVASLFPGHPVLDSRECVTTISDSPKPPPRRITLTLPMLKCARLVIVCAMGAEKTQALRSPDLPFATLLERRGLLLLDPDAAGE